MKTLKYLSVFVYVLCVMIQPLWAASNSETEEPIKIIEETLSPITINVGVLISTIGSNGWRQTAIPQEWKALSLMRLFCWMISPSSLNKQE